MHKMYIMAMKPTATAEKEGPPRQARSADQGEKCVERFQDVRAPLAMATALTWLEHLNRVEDPGERIIIGKRGKPVAALVPMADSKMWRASEDAIDSTGRPQGAPRGRK